MSQLRKSLVGRNPSDLPSAAPQDKRNPWRWNKKKVADLAADTDRKLAFNALWRAATATQRKRKSTWRLDTSLPVALFQHGSSNWFFIEFHLHLIACFLMALTRFSSFKNLFQGEISMEFDFDLCRSIALETLYIFVFECKSIGRSVGSENGNKEQQCHLSSLLCGRFAAERLVWWNFTQKNFDRTGQELSIGV